VGDARTPEQQQRDFDAFLAQVRWEREHPWWRPGAMRPEERERLVRIGLDVVLGDRAGEVTVTRLPSDTIEVGEEGRSFGFPIDTVLGDDTRTVFEHDIEWLVDELCEMDVAWAKRLPECPVHPDSHPLDLRFTDTTVTASCPVTGEEIRSARYDP
jgi:hypothetical protein